ncbi:MAG: beta-lactamase family protein [Acidobacteria bacterium]|nr:beta-lactamase family protein [Acidobacteriota bacterium]
MPVKTRHRRARLVAMMIMVVLPPVFMAETQVADAQPARFTNPDRRTKLAAAFPEIDRLFSDFVTRARVPGAAWGIVVDGDLVHTGTFGHRELASKAPVDADTVFRIASMTKSFTAMAILKLREQGKLALDDPAERYVPELKGLTYPTTDSPRITIRHLLSHAEGFPEDNPWGDQPCRIVTTSRHTFSNR